MLYEEAIQRRWMAHIDIPWDSIQTLPRELELSMCQLSTELAQQASIETDCIGQWVGRMNYAYHEEHEDRENSSTNKITEP